MVYTYDSILNFINFHTDVMSNAYYPFENFNLPYAVSYGLWEIIGGALAWLINLIFPLHADRVHRRLRGHAHILVDGA